MVIRSFKIQNRNIEVATTVLGLNWMEKVSLGCERVKRVAFEDLLLCFQSEMADYEIVVYRKFLKIDDSVLIV